jgi:hypothetical protein
MSKRTKVILITVGIFLTIGIIGGLADGPDPVAVAVETTTTTQATTTTEPTTTTTDRATTTTQPATTTTTMPTLGSGTYIVSEEALPGIPHIVPGVYRVVGYWARMDSSQEIIDNDGVYDNGLTLLKVEASDAYIELSGEAVAFEDFPGLFDTNSVNPIVMEWTEGTYLIGVDLTPGEYMVSPIDGRAYYARLDESIGIIDNDFTEGQTIIRIAEGDYAFRFTGTLERLGD